MSETPVIPKKYHFFRPTKDSTPKHLIQLSRKKGLHNNKIAVYFQRENQTYPIMTPRLPLISLSLSIYHRILLQKLKRGRYEVSLKTLTPHKLLKSLDLDHLSDRDTNQFRQLRGLRNLQHLKLTLRDSVFEKPIGFNLSEYLPHLKTLIINIISVDPEILETSWALPFFRDLKNLKTLQSFCLDLRVNSEIAMEILKTVISNIIKVPRFRIQACIGNDIIVNFEENQAFWRQLDGLFIDKVRVASDEENDLIQKSKKSFSLRFSSFPKPKQLASQLTFLRHFQEDSPLKTLIIQKSVLKIFPKLPSEFRNLVLSEEFLDLEGVRQLENFLRPVKSLGSLSYKLAKLPTEELRSLYKLPCFSEIEGHDLVLPISESDLYDEELIGEITEILGSLKSLKKVKFQLYELSSLTFLTNILSNYSNLTSLDLEFVQKTGAGLAISELTLEIPFQSFPSLTDLAIRMRKLTRESALNLMKGICKLEDLRFLSLIGDCLQNVSDKTDWFHSRLGQLKKLERKDIRRWGSWYKG